MPLVTYGYHITPPLPDEVTLDGVTYKRTPRLPRNLRRDDVLLIGDNTDRRQYHTALVVVTDVTSWPTSYQGIRRYGPQVRVSFRLPPQYDVWRWQSWRNHITYYESETREPVEHAYRAPRKKVDS